MFKPILSICIPTYNRGIYLKNTLNQLVKEDIFLNTNDVEIVVSDNCSNDETEDICTDFKNKYGEKISYFKQSTNIKDKNFAFVLGIAKGKYAKLNNDNSIFKPGQLSKLVSLLKTKDVPDIVLLTNNA